MGVRVLQCHNGTGSGGGIGLGSSSGLGSSRCISGRCILKERKHTATDKYQHEDDYTDDDADAGA